LPTLNIIMLNYEFPPIGGGAANANLCLLNQFANNSKLKIDVLTSNQNPGIVTEQFAENITIYKVGIHKKQLHYWRKIEVIEWLIKARRYQKKLMRKNNYHLAHAFFGFPTGWLCYRTKNKLPYIISLRGSDVPGKNARLQRDYKILAPIFKAIWKNAASLVACSQGLKTRSLQFLPSVDINVITNGVDTERFHPAKTKQNPDTLKLLTVGRLSSTKRVETLIDAVEILHKNNINVQFTIAGDGSLMDQLKQLVSQKKLDDNIKFTGRTDPEEMPQLYRQSDIYISATMQEGMSNAMLEAMASGLPIVTAPCEGLEELIDNNGIILESETPQAIADTVTKLAENQNEYNQMSIAATNQAKKFSWNNAAQEYLNIYKTVANRYIKCYRDIVANKS